jgi:hypothetical protein
MQVIARRFNVCDREKTSPSTVANRPNNVPPLERAQRTFGAGHFACRAGDSMEFDCIGLGIHEA